MRLRYYFMGTLAAGLLLVTAVTLHAGLGDVLQVLAGASLAFLGGYLAASLLIALVQTYKWRLVLESQGFSLPYNRLFAYRLVGHSVGYLTPTVHLGSEPVRAFLLRREGIPANDAVSNVIIDKSVELIANVTFFFVGALLLLNASVGRDVKIFTLLLSALLVLLMGAFIAGILNKRSMFIGTFRFLRLHRVRRLRQYESDLGQVEKQIEAFYRTKKKHFIALILLIAALWGLMYLEYFFLLRLIGYEANAVQIFLVLTGVGLAYALPIPAAIGTLEIGQVSASRMLNLSAAAGVALAFVIRARDIAWTVVGLAFMAAYQFSFGRLARKNRELDLEKGALRSRT